MTRALAFLGRFAVTAALLALAVVVGTALWDYYLEAPWTRDGRVRAEVVGVAPDVSGLVRDVAVHDNQEVKRGDVLFRIDPDRFALALRQAEAVVAGRKDGSLAVAAHKLDHFEKDTRSLLDLYSACALVRRVDASSLRSQDQVWADVRALLLPRTVFVLGGPGSGKGTQCARAVRTTTLSHTIVMRIGRVMPSTSAAGAVMKNGGGEPGA